MHRTLAPLLLALVACSGDPATTKTTPSDDNNNDDTTDEATLETADTASGPYYFEPVAVGFEFQGGITDIGELTNYTIDGTEYLGSITLIFASEEFFQTADDKVQEANSCFMIAPLTGPMIPPPAQIPNDDAAALFSSYEVALAAEPERSDCAGKVDPKIWGAKAENLLQPWVGARFGLGFGPMTDYLRDQWSKETLADFGDAMIASYIAINDASGTWIGEDWTTTFVWEWDPVASGPLIDDDDLLTKIDVSGQQPATRLPAAYLNSNAYWYQDFPLLDLSNLTDGAP